MNEKLNLLFRFRDNLKEVIKWEWTEQTRNELKARLETIESEIYAQSDDNRRVQSTISKEVEQTAKDNSFYQGR